MADTLESLEIEIKHSATGVADEIRSVTSAVKSLGKALEKVMPTLKAFNSAMGGSSITFNDNSTRQVADTIENVKQAASGAKSATTDMATGVSSLSKAASKAKKPLDVFIASLKRIAFYRFIRSIIKAITEAFKEGLENAHDFSEAITTEGHRFATAMDSISSAGLKMKNQLGSALAGLLATIAPIVNQIIAVITRIADAISQFFAAFTGGTYLKAKDTFQEWGDTASAGAAATKEWKNQLMGFDEINKLTEPSGGGGGSGKVKPDVSKMFEDMKLDAWAQKIHDSLALIEMVAGGMMLGLGCVLAFSGTNIPLGLALIAAGIASMIHASGLDWSAVPNNVATTLHNITLIAGMSLLAIGVVLALTGNLPLGIGLIAAGLAGVATAGAIRWNLCDANVKKELTKITAYASLFVFAVGAIVALSGFNIPLGIGMMAAGVVGFATTINWDFLGNTVSDKMKNIERIVSMSLLALGTIFLFVPGMQAIGIGMLIAGGATVFALGASFDPDGFVHSLLHPLETLKQGFLDLYQTIVDTWNAIVSFFSSFNETAASIQADGSVYLQGFASGGFPDAGQLFLARESGPEMVGTVSGRTAVATNNDIVTAVANGVADAVSSVMGNQGGQPVNVKVYLDSREIRAGQQRLARAMG